MWYDKNMVTPEVINYIKSQLASGQTIEAITATLINQKWPKEDVSEAISKALSNNLTSNPQPVSTVDKPKSKILLIIIVAILLIILALAGIFLYSSNVGKSYGDSKYGFEIRNQQGWGKPKLKTDVYYALGTGTSNSIVSSFNVNPIKREGTDSQKLATFQEFCKETATEGVNPLYDINETQVNNLQGYLCEYETKPTNIDKLYKFRIYLLLNTQTKDYDYVISVSYPKDDLSEEQKVNKVLDSFFAK